MLKNHKLFHNEHHHEHHHEHHEHSGCCCHNHHSHDEHHGHDEEHEESPLKKVIICAVLFLTALVLEHFSNYVSGKISFLPEQYRTLSVRSVYLLLYAVSYLFCGLEVLHEAFENIAEGHWFGEEFLMGIATVGAIFMGEYSEACAVMILFQFGEFLEDKAVEHSKKSITSLMNLKTDEAVVKSENGNIKTKTEDVKPGEIIIVKSGERIPLDGTVVSGNAELDMAALTGECVPVHAKEGDSVLSGGICTNGVLEIKVTCTSKESTVSRILKLVEESQEKKAKSEKFITRFAKKYTPVVCIIAVAVAVLPPAILGGTSQIWKTWIYRALELLVASCPCALVISVPLSFFSGIGLASKKGILFKGSNGIENLSRTKTFVFDKTGTLTKGEFKVQEVISVSEKFSEEELLSLAAHAEYISEHPVSRSMRTAHSCPMCGKCEIKNVEEIAGHGLKCSVEGKNVLIGNTLLMHRENISGFDESKSSEKTGTIIHISVDGEYAGFILINDSLKENAVIIAGALKKEGAERIVMLTGDSEKAASPAAKKINADAYYSQLLPQDKVRKIEEEISSAKKRFGKKSTVAFAGDGINDAPVLMRSDTGISMGSLGSDSAVEASDVVIMDDSLLKIKDAFKTSKKIMANVKENIVFSLIVKTGIMAACASGFADMWLAVFADVGVTLLAVLNSSRLLLGAQKNKTGKSND